MISGMIFFYDLSDTTRIPTHENAYSANDMIMVNLAVS